MSAHSGLLARARRPGDSRRDAGPALSLQALAADEVDEVADAARVSPFVVVPGDDLYQVAPDHARHGRVHDGGAGIAAVIHGDQFRVLIAQVALKGSGRGGLLHGRVHFLGGGLLLHPGHQVHHGNVGRGHAHGKAVELALEFGYDQVQRLGGAGGGGNHAERGGAGTAQVLVRKIQNDLVVGIGVDGGHAAGHNFEGIVHHFGNRRQAVGGAGGVGNNVVLGRIVNLLVHPQHESDVLVLGRGGDDHLLHRAAQVLFGVLGVGEAAGGFEHHLRSHRVPGQLGRILFREHAEAAPVYANAVGAGADVVAQVAQDGIVLEQVGQGFGVGQVVDRHKFDIAVIERGTQHVAPDAAESINAYFDCHKTSE